MEPAARLRTSERRASVLPMSAIAIRLKRRKRPRTPDPLEWMAIVTTFISLLVVALAVYEPRPIDAFFVPLSLLNVKASWPDVLGYFASLHDD